MLITFPDGSSREFENGTNALDIAAALSQGLRKAVICCEIDGVRSDAFLPIEKDCTLRLLTFADEGGRWTYRHTASHILAQAVKRLWPEVKLAIGPATKEGFYYDFDAPFNFSPEDFKKIEKMMEQIQRENLRLERFELPREEAIRFMEG